MFTLEVIQQAHSQVKSGADFPKYIQDMKKLGVISYEVSLNNSVVHYFGIDNFQISNFTGIESLDISAVLDIEQFKSDLKNHQNGNTDYLTFCQDCSKSGVAKWIMDLDAMMCTYYDREGNNVLVEKIPQ